MARVTVKYPIGSSVKIGEIKGTVTAIHIRGRNHRTYEFSYIGSEGDPKSVTCEEVELSQNSERGKVGF